MRGGSEERMLMMKGGERFFFHAYCPSEMQTFAREMRSVARETQTYSDAVDILTF